MIKINVSNSDIDKIIVGISTYNQDAQSAADKILLSRLYGFKGISVFSYDAHVNNLEWFDPILKSMGQIE